MLEALQLTYRVLNDANPSATGMDACRAMTVFTSSMGPWRRVVHGGRQSGSDDRDIGRRLCREHPQPRLLKNVGLIVGTRARNG